MGNGMRHAAHLDFEDITGMETIQRGWNCVVARREFYQELEEPRATSLVVTGPCDLVKHRHYETRVPRDIPIPRIRVT
jgi:hypothetical protein